MKAKKPPEWAAFSDENQATDPPSGVRLDMVRGEKHLERDYKDRERPIKINF